MSLTPMAPAALVALAMVCAVHQAYAQELVTSTHCKVDERVVFSCPFKHGKTASLCASANLTKTTGTLQYRYGVTGKKLELVFPRLGDHENPIYDHPSWNFGWSSNYSVSLNKGRGYASLGNPGFSTATVPPGDSMSIYVDFAPIEEHPEITFRVAAQVGPRSRYQGVILTVYESIGNGRVIAEHRCIKENTTEDLFSLNGILQK